MNTRIAAIGLVILALVAGGFAFYIATQHQPGVKITTPSVNSTTNPSTNNNTSVQPAPKEATVYTVDEAHGDENALAPVKVAVADPRSPARSVLQSLIETSNSPLPTGTRLLSVKINDGLATVDFSGEFQKNFHGGDEQEAQAVNSVLMTLGQFHSVDRVQFLVDGTAIDSLGGHFELNDPVDVIRPSRQAKAE
jgi:germination protein M